MNTFADLLHCFSVQHFRESSLQMAFLGKCLLSTQIRLVIKCSENKIDVFTLYPCMLASNWLFSMNVHKIQKIRIACISVNIFIKPFFFIGDSILFTLQ